MTAPTMTGDLAFARPAIAWKEAALGSNPMNAMPPTVRAWRGGRLLATIVANEVDKELGFEAANLARQALRADRVVAAFDSYLKAEPVGPGREARPGETPRQAAERFLKEDRVPAGTYQRMFADPYTREREEVMEGLVVVDARVDAPPAVATLPFLIDEGPPPRVIWHEGRFAAFVADERAAACGPLVDTLARILARPFNATILEESERVGEAMGLTADRRQLHRDRASFQFLRSSGFAVEDHSSRWTEAQVRSMMPGPGRE